MLCVGLPKMRVADLQKTIISSGRDTVRNVQTWIVGIGLISLGFFAIVSLVIATQIVNPLIQSVDFARSIARGDLTVTMRVKRKDEIGRLVDVLKEMSSKLREIVSIIKDAADNVASSSQMMQARAAQMSRGASEQAEATEETSSSMEEMAVNIRQNADNARQTENLAIKAAENAQKGGVAVAETINAMQMIAQKRNARVAKLRSL